MITRTKIFSFRQVLLFLLLLFFTFHLSPFTYKSFANPLDYYGYGSRAAGMGNAQTALANDFSAVYYNPAALVMAERSSIGVGFSYNYIGLKTSRLAKNGQDFNIHDIDPLYGYTLGICLPLKGKLRGKAAIGIGSFFLGDWYYIKTRSQELDEPEFIIDQVRNRRQEVAIGVAYRPIKVVSVGFGVHITPDGKGTSTMSIDVPELKGLNGGYPPTFVVDWDLKTHMSFMAGVHFQIRKNLAAGINFRDKVDVLFSIPVEMQLTNLGMIILEQETAKTHIISHVSYTPRHVNFGVYYSPIDRLNLVADLFWYQWSDFPNPAPSIKISSDVTILPQPKFVPNPDPNFSNTFSPNLGAEYKLTPKVMLRGGYSFVPTPVPDQKGESNFLDKNRHILALGTGILFQDPFNLFGQPIRMDLHFQYHILGSQNITKSATIQNDYNNRTNLGEYPYSTQYGMSGNIFGGGITFSLTL
ncbi:MAG: outer membrane protein transport protein [Proteobacteria bacterium]|nr:outer membrane protein transport protein [Pseudomonadota bacterium]